MCFFRIFVPQALLTYISGLSSRRQSDGLLIGHQIDTKTLFIVAFVSDENKKTVDLTCKPTNKNRIIQRKLGIVGIIGRESSERFDEIERYVSASSTSDTIFVHLTVKPEEKTRVAVKSLFQSGLKIDHVNKVCDVFVFEPADFTSTTLDDDVIVDHDLLRPAVEEISLVGGRPMSVKNDVKRPDVLMQILRARSVVRRHVSELPPSAMNFFEHVDGAEQKNFIVRCSMPAIRVCRLAIVFFACAVQTSFRYSGLLDITLVSSPYVNLANQARIRMRQIEYLNSVSQKNNSISHWNIVCVVAFDLALGIAVTWTLGRFLSAETLFNVFLETAEMIVAELKDLLGWMMGSPAGFKLNLPLNYSLGTFFLFHIYLWKEYLGMIKPALSVILQSALYTGVFGFTFQLSLLQDLLALSTFHVYCFYAYAAKLYGLHVAGLAAFGRLFRGKKWNPLRQRVDSFSYGTDQLFMGTLALTVLLFLMPTTALYYLVFTTLRLAILAVQGLLQKLRAFMNSAPIYTLLLYLLQSKQLISDIRVSVVPPPIIDDGMLVFRIEGTVRFETEKPISAFPEQAEAHESSSWGGFVRNLIVGKLVYPI